MLGLRVRADEPRLLGLREHRRFVMKYLKESGPARTQVERVLALLVESGILYCVLWVRELQYRLIATN